MPERAVLSHGSGVPTHTPDDDETYLDDATGRLYGWDGADWNTVGQPDLLAGTPALPTTENGVPGVWWNNAGVVSVGEAETAALTGTAEPSATEVEIVTGGETIILTLTHGQWVAAGAVFDATRQAIIDGLVSDGAEAAGWNVEVIAALDVTDVVRTSATVVTVTLPAVAGYQITADETITATIPAAATTAGVAVEAAPTFDVTFTP